VEHRGDRKSIIFESFSYSLLLELAGLVLNIPGIEVGSVDEHKHFVNEEEGSEHQKKIEPHLTPSLPSVVTYFLSDVDSARTSC
jgi:hypothetical protein